MPGAKQTVIEIFDRWNAGEREFDPSTFTPDIQVHSAMTNTSYTGEEGLRRWVGEIDEQFAEWGLRMSVVDEPVEGTVIAAGSIHGQGRGSGVAFDQPASWLVEVEAGQVKILRTFMGAEAAQAFFDGAGETGVA